jgi:predicted RecB family nuclease
VLQTSFYSHLLADLQGIEPRWMHLALGNGEFASFKVDEFAAYERQTRRLLEDAIDGDPAAEVYPEPVEHCAICRWRDMCRERRRTDDDLSLVAGMTTGQRRALKGDGISTRRGFAGLADLPRLDRVSRDSLERSRLQARLQVASEDDGVIRYELLDPERDGDGALVANRGLLALPEPAEGDLFFDIEGARYYSEDSREFGLQYLFGVVDTAEADGAGLPRYTQIWACDRQGEKRAFEELIDFITERRAHHPGLHVATSRARALAIIVASPDLIRVSCRTPHQMVLGNALCRAWEIGFESAARALPAGASLPGRPAGGPT